MYYKATVNKTGSSGNLLNRLESPEINSCIYDELIFNKSDKTIQGGKKDNWLSMCKRMKLDPFLTPHTKFNSKWIIALNIRTISIKFLEENRSKSLQLCIRQSLIVYISKAQGQKKNAYQTLPKIKVFVPQTTSSRKWKHGPQNENISKSYKW